MAVFRERMMLLLNQFSTPYATPKEGKPQTIEYLNMVSITFDIIIIHELQGFIQH